MLILEHKKTKSKYIVRHTFPNKEGKITVYIQSKGYWALPSIECGTTIYEFLSKEYPMLEIIEDRTFDKLANYKGMENLLLNK